MFLRPRLEECVLYHVSKKLSLYPSHHFPYIKGCIWFGLLVLLTQTSHHSKYNLFVHCHLIQWSLHLLNVAFIIFMLANDHFEPPYTSFSGLLMMFEEAQAGIISSHTVDIFSKIQIVSWIHAQYRITAVKIKSAKLSVLRPWLWHWTHQYCSYRRKALVFLQREPYFRKKYFTSLRNCCSTGRCTRSFFFYIGAVWCFHIWFRLRRSSLEWQVLFWCLRIKSARWHASRQPRKPARVGIIGRFCGRTLPSADCMTSEGPGFTQTVWQLAFVQFWRFCARQGVSGYNVLFDDFLGVCGSPRYISHVLFCCTC